LKKTRVFIDADACPVLNEAVRIATIRGFEVVLAGNDTQNLKRFADTDGVSIIEVPVGRDSADFALALEVSPSDIVVTDDIGLASIALGRSARVLTSRGYEYNTQTIDFELHLRHEGQKIRRSGGRTKGPKGFTPDDRTRFVDVLKTALKHT